MAVGNAVLDVLLGEGFLEGVERIGKKLRQSLDQLVRRHPQVFSEVRGQGLLLGLKCVPPAGDILEAVRAEGLLAVTAGENVLRIVPPLVIGPSHVDEAAGILGKVAASFAERALKGAA
jgi:acetylornithine/N-succinyldiaminopimelate aminotransferase